MNTRHLAPILLIASAACASSPPPIEARVPAGTVRAHDSADAQALAALAADLAPRVRALLDVEATEPFKIYLLPDCEKAGVRVWRDRSGRVFDRRIELNARSMNLARFVVAHELVHWNVSGVWARMPRALEEGVADYIGVELAPECRSLYKGQRRADARELSPADVGAALRVRFGEQDAINAEDSHGAYTVGFYVVERIGLDGVRALCERAEREGLPRVPAEWIIDSVTWPFTESPR